MKNKMNRTQIYFSDRQEEFFKKRTSELQISKSEYIRRLIDAEISKEALKDISLAPNK